MTADAIRNLLTRNGLRCTAQREVIYAALAASKAHPTAEELHGVVRPRGDAGGMSLATVYNTLDAFTRHGIARRIGPTCGGSAAAFRYDADLANHAHVILADGTMQDLPAELSERIMAHIPRDLVAEVERHLGIQIKRVGVEFLQAP
jgi:Fur family transcriptional regulator, peroxide stress response regulator